MRMVNEVVVAVGEIIPKPELEKNQHHGQKRERKQQWCRNRCYRQHHRDRAEDTPAEALAPVADESLSRGFEHVPGLRLSTLCSHGECVWRRPSRRRRTAGRTPAQ